MRIAVDAMGGDFGPEPIVKGAIDALLAHEEFSLTLVGDESKIQPLVELPAEQRDRIKIQHTTEFVEMHESPARALRTKPKSSINLCWQLLASGAVDGLVSAGNTGAVVAGGLMTRRFLGEIQRPGIAVIMPTITGSAVMLDVGANVHPKPEHLFQYGIMGSSFAKQLLGKESPRVGLLNIGSEDQKGNDLAKQTAAMFQKSALKQNFRGNIEGRDIFRGDIDVVVCDGFVGNIVLKTCEGMVDFMMREVANEVLPFLTTEQDTAKHAMRKLHMKHHHSEFGGAPLLGIDGVCLICHGASDAKAIRNAIRAAKRYAEVNKLILRDLQVVQTEAE